MIDRWNIIIKYTYIVFTIVPIVFLLISVGSYWSVYAAFGDVPSTGIDFDFFQGDINVFPTGPGKVLIVTFFICSFIAMPVIIVANAVVQIIKREVIFRKLQAGLLFTINALALVLLVSSDVVGWYVGYALG